MRTSFTLCQWCGASVEILVCAHPEGGEYIQDALGVCQYSAEIDNGDTDVRHRVVDLGWYPEYPELAQ